MELLIFFIIIGIVLRLKGRRPKQNDHPPAYTEYEEIDGNEAAGKEPVKIDYSKAYQPKYLLTQNEYYNYKKLKEYADAEGWIICPKVRILDIIEPRSGKNYKHLFRKVQSKHVDFVICDERMRIKGILELDDSSHDRIDRKERDCFVDQILTGVGYKVIHARGITETTLNPIREHVKEKTKATKKQVSPTGWAFNEETELWEPPENMKTEADKKTIRTPSYEEWKAAKQKEQDRKESN